MVRKNVYIHPIDLKKLRIKNCYRNSFRQKLENMPYRGYEVEQLKDGRKIVITKPGGKKTFGKIKREDIMVWVYKKEDTRGNRQRTLSWIQTGINSYIAIINSIRASSRPQKAGSD